MLFGSLILNSLTSFLGYGEVWCYIMLIQFANILLILFPFLLMSETGLLFSSFECLCQVLVWKICCPHKNWEIFHLLHSVEEIMKIAIVFFIECLVEFALKEIWEWISHRKCFALFFVCLLVGFNKFRLFHQNCWYFKISFCCQFGTLLCFLRIYLSHLNFQVYWHNHS